MADKPQLSWYDVEKEIRRRLEVTKSKLVRAQSDREVWQLQGEAQALEKLLNLPGTVEILEKG